MISRLLSHQIYKFKIKNHSLGEKMAACFVARLEKLVVQISRLRNRLKSLNIFGILMGKKSSQKILALKNSDLEIIKSLSKSNIKMPNFGKNPTNYVLSATKNQKRSIPLRCHKSLSKIQNMSRKNQKIYISVLLQKPLAVSISNSKILCGDISIFGK